MRWSSMMSLPLPDSYKVKFAGVSPFSGLREVKMHCLTTTQVPRRTQFRTRHQLPPRWICFILGGLTRWTRCHKQTTQPLTVQEI